MARSRRRRPFVVVLALALAACSGGGSAGESSTAECAAPTDCPGADGACRVPTCTAGTCGFADVAAGTRLAVQTPGDCQVVECDGAGGTRSIADDADVATSGDACARAACTDGVPSSELAAAGTACAQDDGSVCDGAGRCVQCLAATDCPGADTECAARTCVAGECGVAFAAAGTALASQTPGDCLVAECDGAGGTRTAAEDGDVPVDGNACTRDACTSGVASNPFTAERSACAQDGGSLCDGVGACVQCLVASDCPGADTECATRTCVAGACGVAFAAAGTALASQAAGDCHVLECDGAGATRSAVNDADVPVDGNSCTQDACTGGVASNPNALAGAACAQDGGTRCDGNGACVQCLAASDCPGADTECATRTCVAGACGVAFAAAGTALASQTPGDCRVVECDGAGATRSAVDDADVPVDGNACTRDVCTGGIPSNPNAQSGSACAQDGGTMCDGSGLCVECVAATDCAGADTDCRTRTCTAGLCGATYAAAGTALASQSPGDCQRLECDGDGATRWVADDADVPVDGNACTDDLCTAGVASNPSAAAHTACAEGGGLWCDGSGACVECTSGSDCATFVCASGACQVATCLDGVRNGDESDVDCGGTACGATCGAWKACRASSDCRSGSCAASTCRPPAVYSISPTGIGVWPSATIWVDFTLPMDPASLASQPADGPCTGGFQLSRDGFATCVATSDPVMSSGGTRATWTPSSPLVAATRYQVRIGGSAHTPGGEPLGSDVTSSPFTTRGSGSGAAVVISQVYGGGSTTTANGATYQYDFVELHNRSALAVTLDGWSVQYEGASGFTWSATPLVGQIAAGGYYLVRAGSPPAPSPASPLPTPDAIGTQFQMTTSGGKVALVAATAALTTTCPAVGTAGVRDLVGYGPAGVSCVEGSGPTAATSPTLAAMRRGSGCQDADDNAVDFVVATPAPRNSASAAVSCGGAVNETDLSAEADSCRLESPASFAVPAGETTPAVYAQLYEAGLTEAAGPPGGVAAELGYGPAGTDPRFDGWTFAPAAYETQVGSDDEYAGTFTAPAAGAWSYAFRFSLDGATWTYCDVDGAGSGTGLTFDVSQLGQLTVTP